MHKFIINRWKVLLSTGLFLVFFSTLMQAQRDVYHEFSGYVGMDYRYFFNDGLYVNQKQGFPSAVFQPEYLYEWNNGDDRIKFIGFFRIDRDEKRSHMDIRELYYQKVKNNWELSVGLKKIFWGVTESVHLVDIINQTDFVESFDGEEKLGQPMVQFSYSTEKFGTFDFFAMPYFRKRAFPGKKGRLRTSFVIDTDEVDFESNSEEGKLDLAARWSAFTGPFDIGVSHFYGTGREPFFTTSETGDFRLLYGVINQTGLDIQATTGPMLWKLEGIVRTSDVQDMFAMAVGFEYSFYNIRESGLDIGIVAEYLRDDRGTRSFSGLDNDVFVGGRFAFNDTQSTEFLIGGIFDLEKTTNLFSVEGNRRLGESWKMELEMRLFNNVDPQEFAYFIRKDSFFQISFNKYF